ncbi:MAG: hypothetical protein FWB71_07025, partial [Defluviitaleaceae bacterium]|nr:hypothetical protein [Defluviitaleaceae bacterium]
LDKVERVLWNGDSHNDTKHQLTEQIVAFLEGMIETTGYEPARKYIASIYSEGAIWLYNNGYHDEACGYFEKQLEHCAKLDEFAASGRPIGDARLGIRDFMAGHFRTDVAKRSAEWMANAPFLAELRENERFQAVIKGVDK